MLLGVISISPIGLSGCGPSQEELMMRAARRTRPKSIDEKAEPKVTRVAEKPKSVATKLPQEPTGGTPEPEVISADLESQGVDVSIVATDVSITPISERVPAAALSADQRNQWSAKNVDQIAAALMAYKKDKGHYPPSGNTVAGMKTVSWRVLILPYLGYEDLYKKFDLNQPWNREPNKSLLSNIPDEFVSPERFDTKTNWLVPTHRKFMFGEGRYPRDRNIEDGLTDTVMLLEVNDELAVEWTKPSDFEPSDLTGVGSMVGGLRPGGTLASWANGWPTLIPSSISSAQWLNALTHESGDGQSGGSIHREVETMLTASREQSSDANTAAPVVTSVAQQTGRVDSTQPTIRSAQQEPERLAIPELSELVAADERVEQLFHADILQAARIQRRGEIAKKLVETSVEMIGDPAGAFALQAIAIEQAIEGGDFNVLELALNTQGGMFEVDRYQLNRDSMIQFIRRNRDIKDSAKLAYVTRALVVLRAGLEKNDFEGVSQLAASLPDLPRNASRVRGGVKLVSAANSLTPDKTVRLLQSLVSAARREFAKVAPALAAHRQNSDDREAASAIGRFYCFIRGDWDTGLPLFIDGTSRKLSDLARSDQSAGKTSEDYVRLGDTWFDLAGGLPQGVYRQGSLDRAEHWYSQAFEVMPESLDRLHVQARLRELAEEVPGSPLAAIDSIAEQLRLDPDTTLQDLTSGQARTGSRGSKPGDDYEDG